MESCLGPNKQAIQKQKYVASMVLAVAGDTIGYKNAKWEFCYYADRIYEELIEITEGRGIHGLYLTKNTWKYSDDTVMHFATARSLIKLADQNSNLGNSYFLQYIAKQLAIQYKNSVKQMQKRSMGKTVEEALNKISSNGQNWNKTQFNEKGWGCGSSMRSACIGLAFHKNKNIDQLIQIAIQSGRITHHNPIGYLGGLVSAYFTSLAIQKIKPNKWIHDFLDEVIPEAKKYLISTGRNVEQNIGQDFQLFVRKCKDYIKLRQIYKNQYNQIQEPVFPSKYGIQERQEEYKTISIQDAWVGSLGFDSVLIAYDALLGCNANWEQLCLRSMIHGGDSDSTGTIAGAWYGAYYGFQNVIISNYKQMQGYQEAKRLGKQLFRQSHRSTTVKKEKVLAKSISESNLNRHQSCQIF